MPEQFDIGDTVQLRSGGPVMTIEQVIDGKSARCVWFDGSKKINSVFALATLEKTAE